jgi:hypothetical protein
VITEQHTKECLSLAYIHAIAGRAGINLSVDRVHDYGIDGSLHPVTIRDGRRVETGFTLDFQLKATVRWSHEDGHVVYDLEAKTYNDLVTRAPEAVRCILIVLCLPEDDAHWSEGSEKEMVLRHCCYWTILDGVGVEATSTKRIRIARGNTLSPEGLNQILRNERARRLGL